MKNLFVSVFILITASLFGQNFEPVKWTYKLNQLNAEEFEIIFEAKIDKGWTVYSQYIDDGGPVPTSIWYETEGVVENIGDANEEGHKKEGMDPIFEMNVIKFLDDQPYVITQKVKVIDPTKKLVGYLTYMTCDDERCLPPTDVDFEFDFGDGKSSLNFQSENIIESVEENPVAWNIDLKKKSGSEFEIIYEAQIEEGWTVYSQYVEEGGPEPTSVWYETEGVVKNIGDAIEEGHSKEGLDPVFGINVKKIPIGRAF